MRQGKDIYEDMYMENLKSFKSFILGLFTVTLLASANCYGQTEAPQDYFIKGPVQHTPTRVQLPIREPELSTFANAADTVGLTHLFQGTGPFTAFVPTNAAFDKLGKDKLQQLLEPQNQDRLTDILIYHIVPGKYMARNLKSMRLQTINGKYLTITTDNNGEIRVNGAKVVRTDLVGPNGVVHEIDTVLIPQ